jgi:hypothetical protein
MTRMCQLSSKSCRIKIFSSTTACVLRVSLKSKSFSQYRNKASIFITVYVILLEKFFALVLFSLKGLPDNGSVQAKSAGYYNDFSLY